MAELTDLLNVFDMERVDDTTLRATSLPLGGSVVFGGQILAQSILAGASVDLTKQVKSIHTIFNRAASIEAPLDYELDVMQTGRAFASTSVTLRQGGKVCARSLVLLHAPDPDLIRHQPTLPEWAGNPEDATVSPHGPDFWDVAVVGGVNIADPALVGPAELGVWTRFVGAPDGQAVNAALLALSTDGFLIGTALRPHEGYGQAMAHTAISTTVITHTVSFHEEFSAGDWLLLDQDSPYAGRGRVRSPS